MTAITINLESNLAPLDVEELTKKLTATANKWIRTRKKQQKSNIEDFFGMFGSNPEDANKSYKELRDEIMKERFSDYESVS